MTSGLGLFDADVDSRKKMCTDLFYLYHYFISQKALPVRTTAGRLILRYIKYNRNVDERREMCARIIAGKFQSIAYLSVRRMLYEKVPNPMLCSNLTNQLFYRYFQFNHNYFRCHKLKLC